MFFNSKNPIPFIVISIVVIIIGIVIMVATGGEGVSGHWEWDF